MESVRRSDDLAYINAPLPSRQRPGVNAAVDRILEHGDDFITIPFPQLAVAPSPSSDRIVTEAVRKYEDEKAVVDERLFHKTTLEMGAGDLAELAQQLTRKTGVSFFASKELEDWKLTVLVKEVPVRDVMRQIVRLFNLEWRRYGEAGKYRYGLIQTLRQKLAEEELKRRDDDEMILDAVNQLDQYRDDLEKKPEELRQRADEAKEKVKTSGSVEEQERWRNRQRMLEILSTADGKDAFTLYTRLTPDQLLGLRNGQKAKFISDGAKDSLPKEVVERMQKSFGSMANNIKINGIPVAQIPPDHLYGEGNIELDRGWPGRAALKANLILSYRDEMGLGQGLGTPITLTEGLPERMRSPGNVELHKSMKPSSAFAAPVSLEVRPRDVLPLEKGSIREQSLSRLQYTEQQNLNSASEIPHATDPKEWIDSADLLTEIHRKTGRNLIADYYLRIYPRSAFHTEGKLLDLLNYNADYLKSEWLQDGDFLRFRRLNFYAEREMDVPNRLLERWKAAEVKEGYLPLEELSEVALMPGPLLWNHDFHRAIVMKYGIVEWNISQYAPNILQFYAHLSPLNKTRIQSDGGLPISELSADEREIGQKVWFVQDALAHPERKNEHVFMRMRKPGWFVWHPHSESTDQPVFPGQELIRDKDREKAGNALERYAKAHADALRTDSIPVRYQLEGPASGLWVCASKDGKYTNMNWWTAN